MGYRLTTSLPTTPKRHGYQRRDRVTVDRRPAIVLTNQAGRTDVLVRFLDDGDVLRVPVTSVRWTADLPVNV